MSIQKNKRFSKKANREVTKYRAVVKDTATGKMIWGKLFLLRKDARKDEKRIINDLEKRTLPLQTENITFHEVAEQWMEASEGNFAPATLQVYQEYYIRYLKDTVGTTQISKLKPMHMQKFVNDLKKKVAPATVNKTISVAKHIFAFAVSPLQMITENPMKDIKRLKVVNKKKAVWTDQEIAKFLQLELVRESPIYTMLCLSFILGARPGEICGLAETDLSGYSLMFNRGIDRNGKITDLKTQGSHRTVQLPDKVAGLLYKQVRRLGKTGWSNNDFLFVNGIGEPYRPDVYSKRFRSLLKQCNKEYELVLPDISLYGARHSFATNNIVDGENIKTVAEIMGNSEKTCLANYTHISRAVQSQAIHNYYNKIAI